MDQLRWSCLLSMKGNFLCITGWTRLLTWCLLPVTLCQNITNTELSYTVPWSPSGCASCYKSEKCACDFCSICSLKMFWVFTYHTLDMIQIWFLCRALICQSLYKADTFLIPAALLDPPSQRMFSIPSRRRRFLSTSKVQVFNFSISVSRAQATVFFSAPFCFLFFPFSHF